MLNFKFVEMTSRVLASFPKVCALEISELDNNDSIQSDSWLARRTLLPNMELEFIQYY